MGDLANAKKFTQFEDLIKTMQKAGGSSPAFLYPISKVYLNLEIKIDDERSS
jgi:hypothetical protein